ncbi:MAG: CZB domain-containing protein, partial [Desulfobulbaceae bacterium]|nr:CZB domain-containing protein [Desulfobulbaceae bacterium]
MKNLSIGLKFFASFGAVIGLLAVVALWSIFGIKGIVVDAEEVIEGNMLRGEMVQKEVDHLNWVAEVNALLTDDTVTELNVETDDHKCGLGMWLYGQGREDAEKMIPSLKGLLKDIEEPHALLHASAVDIDKAFVQADAELPGLIAAREVDHLKWADQIRDTFLQNRDRLDVQTDPELCALGKWMKTDHAREAYKNGDAEFKRVWDEMDAQHKKLHHSAIDVGAAYSQKNMGLEERKREALKVFEEVTAPLLLTTLGHMDTLKKQAEVALSGVAEANVIFATQTQPNLRKVQDLLGSVCETVTDNVMTDEQMIAAASKTNTAVIICSIIALVVGVLFAFIMSRSITGPLAAAVSMITEMSKGHLGMRLKMDRGDEIGKMAKAMDDFADDLQNEMVAALEKLAEGDLTFDANPKDKEDVIGN